MKSAPELRAGNIFNESKYHQAMYFVENRAIDEFSHRLSDVSVFRILVIFLE